MLDYTSPKDLIVPLNFYKRFLYELSILMELNITVLLTGGTGSGKTSLIQFLAEFSKQKLIVENVTKETD